MKKTDYCRRKSDGKNIPITKILSELPAPTSKKESETFHLSLKEKLFEEYSFPEGAWEEHEKDFVETVSQLLQKNGFNPKKSLLSIGIGDDETTPKKETPKKETPPKKEVSPKKEASPKKEVSPKKETSKKETPKKETPKKETDETTKEKKSSGKGTKIWAISSTIIAIVLAILTAINLIGSPTEDVVVEHNNELSCNQYTFSCVIGIDEVETDVVLNTNDTEIIFNLLAPVEVTEDGITYLLYDCASQDGNSHIIIKAPISPTGTCTKYRSSREGELRNMRVFITEEAVTLKTLSHDIVIEI